MTTGVAGWGGHSSRSRSSLVIYAPHAYSAPTTAMEGSAVADSGYFRGQTGVRETMDATYHAGGA